MQRFVCLLLFALVWVWTGEGFAQQPTVEERLIRLEEGQKALIQRVEDTNRRIDDTNRRIDDLRTDMNQRFGELRADMNQRFADLTFWLQTIVGILVLVVGGLLAQWVVMWRRLIKVDERLLNHLQETEKDQMLAFYREEMEGLKARLDRVEAAGRP